MRSASSSQSDEPERGISHKLDFHSLSGVLIRVTDRATRSLRCDQSSGESHHPPRKGYLFAANVSQQEQLRGVDKVTLAGNEVELSPRDKDRTGAKESISLTLP